MTTAKPLNQGQREAADAFTAFLFSDDWAFNISGPGGTGKTHLMSYLIDEAMPAYHDACKMLGVTPEYQDVAMTATTNKAAEVLAQATQRPTATIHSFLNLKVEDDYKTGRQNLKKTLNWYVHERKILFVDECSMVDSPLLSLVREGTHKSKVVFVGDHCQLAPVMEAISPVYKQIPAIPFYGLTEQMRNAGQPALMAVCQQLRETVETGEFKPIKIVPGVIDYLDDAQMQQELTTHFTTQTLENRILAYTNERVLQYNDHIRSIRGLPDEFTIGEYLVNNSAIRLGKTMLSVEEEVEVLSQGPIESMYVEDGVDLKIRDTKIRTSIGEELHVTLPVDRNHFKALLQYYAKIGKQGRGWKTFFDLKNKHPDLRQRDAATVHKSQGSTYDTVFIDMGDISKCHQPNTVARMLYVAFSRPRTRVFLYGQLAEKYGGLTY